MDLLTQTKYLIKKTGLKPDKFLGQNFCIDPSVIQKMIEVADVNNQDIVLEVGPGFGFLTQELLRVAGEVIAVEMDVTLAALLKKLEAVHRNLTVVQDDILKVPSSKIQIPNKFQISNIKSQTQMTDSDTRYPPEADPPLADTICDMRYKIVANLPYSITSAFLRKFLTAENQPRSMTLLVQKEVAERICANAGKMSLLAVSVQLYGRPQIVKIVGKESFWPKPKVDSAILLIDGIHHFPFTDVSEKIFWQVIRSGFSAKRKQLHNNLKNCLHLTLAQVEQIFQQTGINQQVRAQELTLKGWLKLAKNYINILN